MDQVMIGKKNAVALTTGIAFCVAIGILAKKSFSKTVELSESRPSVFQYTNRLKEFFINDNDLSSAKQEFFDLLDMGLTPYDSFEITKAKVVLL